MSGKGAGGGAPQSAKNAAARAAIAARYAAKKALGYNTNASMDPNNKRDVRAAGNAAARLAYNEVKAFLDTEECALVEQADKEFLALALSQLSGAELASLAQRGGSRTQKGGALGQSLINFLRTLCNRVRGAITAADERAAAVVDAAAAATQEDITRGVLMALPVAGAAAAGSMVLTGHNSGIISLALTALKGINSLLPGPATVAINTYSGLAAWLPVGAAAAPVAGKLFTIFVCYRAVVITREFVGARLGEFRTAAGGIDYDGLLRELMNVLYRGIVHGVPAAARAAPGAALAAGRGAAAGAGAAGRGAMVVGRGAVGGVGAVIGVVDGVIDAAVAALLGPANQDAVEDLVDAAVGPDAPAAGGGAAGMNAAVGPDAPAIIAAGAAAGAAAAAAAAAAPAGLDALALMAGAMPPMAAPANAPANANNNNANNGNNSNANNNNANANINNANANNNNSNANNDNSNANNNSNSNSNGVPAAKRPRGPKTRKQAGGKRSKKTRNRKNRK